MLPRNSIYQIGNRTWVHRVSSCNAVYLFGVSVAFSYFQNVYFFEFCASVLLSICFVNFENLDGMSIVLKWRASLQVFDSVVRFYSVFVIDFLLFWSRRVKKRISNELVNFCLIPHVVLRERYNRVSVMICGWVENSDSWISAARLTSNISKIRNAVNSFVAFNWTEFFEGYKKLLRHIGLSVQRLIWLGVRHGSNRSYAGVFSTTFDTQWERSIA